MYQKAKAEAIGKVRKSVREIVDVTALKYNLTEKQRLRLREDIAVCFISSNSKN